MRSNPNLIKCPICGNLDVSILRVFEINDILTACFLNIDNDIKKLVYESIQDTWQGESCLYVRCQSCFFVFAYPFKAGNATLYNLLYGQAHAYPSDKWEFQITKNIIKENCCLDKCTLLEIGPGNGSFISYISPQLISLDNIYVIEHSIAACNLLRKRGVNIIDWAMIGADRASSFKFDIICMFQVLEHLDNIHLLFSQLNCIAKEGTQLFISVPNYKQRALFDHIGIYEDLPPIHIGRYTEEVFDIFCSQYNWVKKEYRAKDASLIELLVRLVKVLFQRSRANRFIDTIQCNYIRRIAKLFFIILFSVYKLKILIPMSKQLLDKKLLSTLEVYGDSQWIYLIKK